MKLGRFVALGAASALVLTMSACNSPGTAAVVEGHTITTDQVTRVTKAFNKASAAEAAAVGQKAEVVPESVILNVLMRGEAAKAIAGKDAPALEGAATSMLKSPDYAAVTKDADSREVMQALAMTKVMGQAVGADSFEAALTKLHPKVNPRYGLTDLSQIKQAADGGPETVSSSLSIKG